MPAMFLGSFFFGEAVVLSAAFLAGQGLWSAWTVFWIALLGTLSADSLWFLYGQKLLGLFHKFEPYRRPSEKFLTALEKITGARPERALLFIKAVYGTRILTIIYLAIRKVNFFKFLIFDAFGSAWWIAILVSFGWLAGRKLVDLVPIIDQLEYTALALVIIVIIWRAIFSWLSKKAIRELEQE